MLCRGRTTALETAQAIYNQEERRVHLLSFCHLRSSRSMRTSGDRETTIAASFSILHQLYISTALRHGRSLSLMTRRGLNGSATI